ncbi:MAG TPA: CDP-alcohol phosphatidyltransferase family protein [Candidatus Dormibacteraeota bacterium]|nr:CDP-alcohol phosphatidyltransferase family protein [Candidatus Dormibacteraeota bacterium]
MTISNEARSRVKAAFEPVALALGRLGLTPDALTLAGFVITVVAAVLLAAGQWLLGGLVMFFGGAFDMLDGTLARATGRVSRLGAFMDSVFDRWGETLVYLGIAIGCARPSFAGAPFLLGTVLAAAAMGAAFMVSYVRAKSEGLGFSTGTGMAEVGVMPREVRLVVLALGLVLAGLTSWLGGAGAPSSGSGGLIVLGFGVDLAAGEGWLALALALIAILATVTVIQRILVVRRQAATIAAAEAATGTRRGS